MRLFIDIGNSRTKLVEETGEFGPVTSVLTDAASLEQAFTAYANTLEKPDSIVASNVAGAGPAGIITAVCRSRWDISPVFLRVSREAAGVRNGYGRFQELGIDRWAAIIGAWNLFHSNVYVVDCGTAVTIDLVLESGEHQGGYIIPGNHLMMQALNRKTSDIKIEQAKIPGLGPGRSTAECIANASLDAVHFFIENKFSSINRDSGQAYRCILTGGGAVELVKRLAIPYQHVPLLVFEGMKLISEIGS